MLRFASVLIMSLCLAAPAAALHTSAGPLPLSALGLKPYSGPAGPRLLTTPPQVGDERVFWAWDLSVMPPADKEVTATCRGVGQTVYVFVENERWGAEMDQDDVDAILEAMDDSTPAGSLDPDSGIVDIEVQAFGPVPDELDDDPRVYLLYYDIGSFEGNRFDGYFNADHQTTGPKSNQVEILFLNTEGQSPSSDYMLAVAGHELNHLLQWGADAAESA